jgi:L-ascorbate metabolism protein UlaG (beta-lactamase superfamily)
MQKKFKMFTGVMITLVVLMFIGFLIIAHYPDNIFYQGPITGHFNGKEFYNPLPYVKRTRLDTLEWMLTRERKQWPSHIDNSPHPVMQNVANAGALRVTFINHSSVLLQTKSLNFLFDPIWSYRASPFQWIGPARVRKPGIAFSELPKIDVVMISHNHYDHLDIATLQALNTKFHPLFIVPLGNKKLLEDSGISNVVELDWWQKKRVANAVITLLPAQHWSARWLNDEFRALWGSYGIEVEKQKIYFAGDTAYENHFINIRKKWGTPKLAFLPIGAYEPEWFMRRNHMNPDEALKATEDLHATYSIGIHFGTFQLSDEAIDKPVADLNTAVDSYNLKNNKFFLLKEGESKELT